MTRAPAAPGTCGDDERRTAPAPGPAVAHGHLRSAASRALAGPAADPGLVRTVLRHHAKGVAVITAGTQPPVGFCATSLTSLSLNPPVVSFSIGLHTSSWSTVEQAGHAIVHLLADDQEDVARCFARPAAPAAAGAGPEPGAKFGPDVDWHRGPHGLPVLDDVLGWFLVALVLRLPVADHALVIGRVVEARHVRNGAPLVHHDGDFVGLERPRIRARQVRSN